jgi:hypothetical protein
MRKSALAFVAALIAGAVLAQQRATSQWSSFSTQPTTQSAPSSGQSTGMATLNKATSLHVLVQCPNLGNVTAGSLTGYYCSPFITLLQKQQCMPLPTTFNCTLPTGASSALCPEQLVNNPFGYIGWMTSGVTCGTDGGSSVVWDGGVLVDMEISQGS